MEENTVLNENAVSFSGIEVRMENLTKEFTDKTGKVTVAVNDFNVTIPGGKLIGLLGPSGCGKSSILNKLLEQDKAFYKWFYYFNFRNHIPSSQ